MKIFTYQSLTYTILKQEKNNQLETHFSVLAISEQDVICPYKKS